jgi:hypothetical protein
VNKVRRPHLPVDDEKLFVFMKTLFSVPPHLVHYETRPWLLDEAIRYVSEPHSVYDGQVVVLRTLIPIMIQHGWNSGE